MRNIPFLLWVLLLVDGVSNEENVSRKEGESVTLKPGEIKEDDIIEWWFDGQKIANMIKGDAITNTFPGRGDIFKDRLKMDDQTGSLTITNISAKHAGVYKLEIKSKTETSTSFNVTVSVYKGVKSMSKMEGDSFSLVIDVKEQKVDKIQWKFEDQVIPTDDLNPDGKWRNIRLNKETGELFIEHIRRDQSGVYKAEINTSSLIVHGEFHITVGVKSMSKMEGDSFSLVIDVKEQKVDKIQWMFGDQVIPTDDLNPDGKWRNIDLNKETGELFIEHIRRDQSGVYKAEINTSSLIVHEEFHITVEIIQIMPVMKGYSVTLNTYSEIQRDDLTIMWMFGEEYTRIAEINREAKKTLYEDVLDGTFRGRVELDRTGSLTITNTKTTDEGLYTVRISSSNRETKNKRFVVTVKVPDLPDQKTPDPGLSSGTVAGIVVGVLLVVFAAAAAGGGIYYRKKISEPKSSNDGAELKESNKPLNS